MRLDLFRHFWGVDEPWDSLLPRVKALGYAGVEVALLMPPSERGRLRELCDQHGLDLVLQIFTCRWERPRTVDEHLASLREQIAAAAPMRPRFLNAQSGYDAWTFADARRFYGEALKIERDAGVVVSHETHRQRVMCTPWMTRDLLTELPDLKITCDFSHWVCVCERIIDDQIDVLRLAAEHCHHIHARVGYPEGPQVPDPRAPEAALALAAHERWWDLCWEAQERKGAGASTLTPEFGPPDYMHTLPYSGVPVANLWEICEWQTARQRERFAARRA